MSEKKPENFAEITSQLSVSSQIKPDHLAFLKSKKIDTIISIVPSKERVASFFRQQGINHVIIPSEGAEHKIFRQISGRTVIHCREGLGSSFVAVAFLVSKGMPVQKAIDLLNHKIKSVRNFSKLDVEFFNSLRQAYLRKHPRKQPRKQSTSRPLRVRSVTKRVKRRSLRG